MSDVQISINGTKYSRMHQVKFVEDKYISFEETCCKLGLEELRLLNNIVFQWTETFLSMKLGISKEMSVTKVSVVGDFLFRIFLYSVRMRENTNPKISEYGHFSGVFYYSCYFLLGKRERNFFWVDNHSRKLDFLTGLEDRFKGPRFCKRKINMFIAIVTSFWDCAIRMMSSKYRIRIIFCLLQIDIGTFRNFVNTLGAGDKTKHRRRNW